MNKVLFKTGTSQEYASLEVKDSKTLYFLTDTHEIYKGDTSYSDSVIFVTDFPADDIIQGKLYINQNTLEAKIYVTNTWKTLNPGYVSSIDGSGSTNDNKLATIAAIKSYVTGSIATHSSKMASDSEAGHVVVDGTTILSSSGTISVGTIAQSHVTDLTTDLAAKAPLASPTFTGTVSLPSEDPSADTQAAHKKYVDSKANTVQGNLDTHATVKATSDSIGHVKVDNSTITVDDGTISVGTIAQSKVTNLTTDLAAKAPLANPTFTGTVTLPVEDPSADTQAAHKKYVDSILEDAKEYADSILGANDAMVYKGTIGTGGTVTALPATHSVGWTYKVITAGTYAGQACEIGDMVICVTDGSIDDNSHWTVVQNNIDGAVIGPATAVANRVAIFDGISGKLLKDSGYTIEKSVPSNAVFTDTTYELSGSISSQNGSVTLNLKDSNSTTDSVTIKGTGNTTVTSDESGVITINSTDSDTTYSLSSSVSTNSATLTLTPSEGEPTTVTFVAGDHVSISLDDSNIKFSVTSFIASEILLTGYTKAETAEAVSPTDNVSVAIGKLEKQIDGKAAVVHNHASQDINVMTGYVKGSSAEDISASDSLNVAIGKLEYGKAPLNAPTFSGTVTSNGDIIAKSSITVTGNVLSAAVPSDDSHLTNKKYVDENIVTKIESYMSWKTL